MFKLNDQKGDIVRKVIFAVLACVALASAKDLKMPTNVRVDVCSAYVAASETVYTNPISLANRAWKVGMVAVRDTAFKDTLGNYNIGDGLRIVAQTGFPTAPSRFAVNKGDTLWRIVGDTVGARFVVAEGLSADSLICSTMDTTSMDRALVGKDSMWVSKGYFNLVNDYSPLTRFKYMGASTLGETVKKVYTIIWSAEYVPTSGEKR
jgi:hypothetical protein